MQVHPIGIGAFLIEEFLSVQECAQMIADSEAGRYEEAPIQTDEGAQLMKNVRNNDRLIFDDPALAQTMFLRARPMLPATLDDWNLLGFNERWRFYRYSVGQRFAWHVDGSFCRTPEEESKITFLIYLNQDFVGGQTQFGWESVAPQTGAALVFPHGTRHQGAAVTSGVKYVLRTDVMYQRARRVR